MPKERYRIADLRQDMAIRLTVTRRSLFKALWEPRGGGKDRLRDELVAQLTRGWEGFEIYRGPPGKMHTAGGRPDVLPIAEKPAAEG